MEWLWKQLTTFGLAVSPFIWKLGVWRYDGVWCAQLGPVAILISHRAISART